MKIQRKKKRKEKKKYQQILEQNHEHTVGISKQCKNKKQ